MTGHLSGRVEKMLRPRPVTKRVIEPIGFHLHFVLRLGLCREKHPTTIRITFNSARVFLSSLTANYGGDGAFCATNMACKRAL
jgi:hypothetical protein